MDKGDLRQVITGPFAPRIFKIRDIWTNSEGVKQIVLMDPKTGMDFCREDEFTVEQLTEAIE